MRIKDKEYYHLYVYLYIFIYSTSKIVFHTHFTIRNEGSSDHKIFLWQKLPLFSNNFFHQTHTLSLYILTINSTPLIQTNITTDTHQDHNLNQTKPELSHRLISLLHINKANVSKLGYYITIRPVHFWQRKNGFICSVLEWLKSRFPCGI